MKNIKKPKEDRPKEKKSEPIEQRCVNCTTTFELEKKDFENIMEYDTNDNYPCHGPYIEFIKCPNCQSLVNIRSGKESREKEITMIVK